jgi:hypothetical protein
MNKRNMTQIRIRHAKTSIDIIFMIS